MKIIEDYKFAKEIFKVEAQPALLAQAVRVFQANQRQGTQSTLTRTEVSGTTKKMYRQKGTGHARHGDRKAPIFVGGGQAFGPKPRDFSLKLPQKMRQLALKMALSQALKDKKIIVISGLEKLTGKTSELAKFLDGKTGLFVPHKFLANLWRAGRNIPGITIAPFNQLNAYEILKAKKIYWDEKIPDKSE